MTDKRLLKQLSEGQLIINFLRNTDKTAADQQTWEVLRQRSTLLESYWGKVANRHSDLDPDEEELKHAPYFTADLFSRYEEAYVVSKAELERRLATLAPPPAILPVAEPRPADVGSSALARLPKLTLPHFSGNQIEWDTFKERFCSMVKDVASISPVLKLQYLLSCLEGPAAKRLANLEVTTANFEVAWNSLIKRYDNSRVRQSARMSRMLSLPPASQKSASEITRLLDEVEEGIRALRFIGRPVEQWGDWFVEILSSRLDPSTREDWEKSLEGTVGFPTYQQMSDFLENRARSLEASKPQPSQPKLQHNKIVIKSNKSLSAFHSSSSAESTPSKSSQARGGCTMCRGSHFIGYCPSFLSLDASKRREHVQGARLCYNCLSAKHQVAQCGSKGHCSTPGCQERHHTQLHMPQSSAATVLKDSPASASTSTSKVSAHTTQVSNQTHLSRPKQGHVTLLATAWVVLESFEGTSITVRALIDPASEGSFLTVKVTQALSLNQRKSSTSICGVGGSSNITSNYSTEVILRSKQQADFNLSFSALILGNLTSILPRERCREGSWTHLQGLDLADPTYCEPSSIDCILGADVYSAILLQGVRKGAIDQPIAQETVLGWILTGPATIHAPSSAAQTLRSFHTTTSTTNELIRKFWENEEINPRPLLSTEELDCEEHFCKTHRRDSTGRFILRLPFITPPVLGDSLSAAQARFLQVERRMEAKPELKKAYVNFIEEIKELRHMESVSDCQTPPPASYYLPHHAVFKSDGSGKIRVVFNASQPSKNGVSLNDRLHIGQKLQADIIDVLTRWRLFPVVFTADIIKMFRQFLVDGRDRDWLRIVWRDSPQKALQTYRMCTVVYGTACAPFQANRAMLQLAQDEQAAFPVAAEILRSHIYVDDILAGADTLEDALYSRDQVINLLQTAGMDLDKWSANHPGLLQDLHHSTNELRNLNVEDIVATLGLQWNPSADFFCYRVTLCPNAPSVTKRTMLSEIARLYDPLGWLAPVVIMGKILIQQLWIAGTDWDQPVPQQIFASWSTLRDQLPILETLHIPRWVCTRGSSRYYLHGFADASNYAYAAVVYLVARTEQDGYSSKVLMAKTKVAPIKTISIPRLELCGALLLARLMSKILAALQSPPAGVYCWSDSQVTLAWLSSQPSRWTTFVANRVSEALTVLPGASWSHVKTNENPADLASRGVMPSKFAAQRLWWEGPAWLTTHWEQWITPQPPPTTVIDERRSCAVFATPLDRAAEQPMESWLKRISRLSTATRAIAYALRWSPRRQQPEDLDQSSPLSADELLRAERALIFAVQNEFYASDIARLHGHRLLSRASPLRRLLPYLDENGLIRVGGRLQHAFLSEAEKHPLIVPSNSRAAELLIQDAHLRTLHGGPQLVTSHLLRSYWLVRSRNRIRKLIRQCVKCTRFRGQLQGQQMAPLPAVRVTPARPFTTTGLDYAGPFLMRTSKGRGQKAYKGYVAIFVCMVTRAVHIEVVSDYSSQTFLAAFKRFVSRRGLCSVVYSDNGTTFQGANAELQRLFNNTSQFSREVAEAIAKDRVSWSFIPPRAPHFGGLWEAGVKAFKHHLRRVLGEAKLTYEEFTTLTSQIEACLNSRPLAPLSNDPEDLAALTPGHFLVGTALTAPPEPLDDLLSVSGVPRYRWTTIMQNHFWKRWQAEVLRLLQQRQKWLKSTATVNEGDLVLITDELLPPTKWPLARVAQLHPGADGLNRVLTLRTATSILQRPLAKVIRLPVDLEPPSDVEAATPSGTPSVTPSVTPPALLTAGGSQGTDALHSDDDILEDPQNQQDF